MNSPNHKGLFWHESAKTHLDRESLLDLINNNIPLISIDDFATVEECESLAQQACVHGFDPYEGVEPRITRIGCTVFEHDAMNKEGYFAEAARMRLVQGRIFDASWNPIGRLIEYIVSRTGIDVQIAQDAHGRPYYAGLIRRIEKGTLLHIDYAPIEQNQWSVCDVVAQLSWNLYLRISDSNAGHTHIYDRQWLPADMDYREGGYGFSKPVIAGAAQYTLRPMVGQLALFNTKNYHQVESTRGERIAVTSAIGMMPKGDLVLWS